MRITEETIGKIYDAAEIVEVISKFVELKKSGVNYRGLCPFHQDHTPSLYISPSRQIFKCFVCGEGGNAVTFLMKHENMTYPEALRWLAKKYSIDIQECEMSEEQEALMKKRDSLFSNMAIVEDYYHKEFLKSEKAQQYAYGRWGKDYCDLIRIGYAPGYSRNIDKLGISQDTLRELGLCDRNGNDLFRERITISIRDRFGRVIGFTCRNFDGSQPKYLNNKESEIFHKNEVLFGIDTAWKPMKQAGVAYLVEGAPDCYRLQAIGVQNTVACLGSSWNVNHFHQLKKAAAKVCFIPDSDEMKPGQKLPHGIQVVTDAGRLAIEQGLSVSVKEIPSNGNVKQDADSYFKDKAIFDSLPEQDFVLWLAEKLFSASTTIDEKTDALNNVVSVLRSLNDPMKADFYVAELKKYTDRKMNTWKNALKGKKKSSKSTSSTSNNNSYGFFIKDGQYAAETESGTRTLSNFILNPLFHVQDAIQPLRLFEIENVEHEKNLIELRSEDMISSDKFEARVNDQGNYMWWGGKSDLKKIKAYLIANMKTAQLVKQLGWQQRGFFAFGNGIFDGQEFHEADLNGIVSLEDFGNYYLPSHSAKYMSERNLFVFEHGFIYRKGATVTLREVTDQIFRVFGENGQVTFLFLLASLFHDIVAHTSSPGWFPLLDLFGPMGTGKTALAELMAAFFTTKQSPSFRNSTVPGLAAEVAAAANAVVVINEYKNDLDDSMIEFLKGLWDLIGRTRMSMTVDGQKEMTAVDSGVIITGQEMPTKDNALFSRTIFLTFSKSEFTCEETDEFNKLATLRKEGLTHLTLELLKFREKMEQEYENTFREVSADLKKSIGYTCNERIINNWAVPLSSYKVLRNELNVNIDYNKIRQFILEGVKRQNNASKTSDELASFWSVIQYLFNEKRILNDGHFRIVNTHEIIFKDSSNHYKWDNPHAVLYLRKAGIIEIYEEACAKLRYKVLPKESLKFYIQKSSYYLGEKVYNFLKFDKSGNIEKELGKFDEHGNLKPKSISARTYCFDYEKIQQMYSMELEHSNVTEEITYKEDDVF